MELELSIDDLLNKRRVESDRISVRVNAEQERELINMTSYAPFDTRPNFEATESDILVALLTDHLNTTKSKLAKQIGKRGVMEVLGDMQLLVGPPEQQCISNAALMMRFSKGNI